MNSINEIKILTVDDLSPLLRRTIRSIKADASRRPESLPPRVRIPQSNALIWFEKDVLEWLDNCREAKTNKE